MSAILPFVKIDSDSLLTDYFTIYQIAWIQAEDPFHAQKKQVFALAEKSVRIGWTFCDGFKNVRKRLRFPRRDYLFATKDWPSALEYMKDAYTFADVMGYTRAILSHGEDILKTLHLDPDGKQTSITEEVRVGYIKFDNGSRIIAFSSNPYAMAVYGGDVGLDEFAKHPNAKLLWQTAQARVTWANDLAVWSSHDGEDTLFNEFAMQARATCSSIATARNAVPSVPNQNGKDAFHSVPDPSPIEIQKSKFKNPESPWNLYFKVTMPDALELGLLDIINQTKNTNLTPEQFLADRRALAGSEEVFQQSYMCNPVGSATNHIVEWSAIERCRFDYDILRVHLEHDQIIEQFGEFQTHEQQRREYEISQFIHKKFLKLFQTKGRYRAGLDVANSGQGNLAVFYIDEVKGEDLWLRGLFSCRTEDWNFLQTVVTKFLRELSSIQACGDSSGLGRQICWELNKQFGSRFSTVNFGSKKHDLGFTLMNQLATARKRFPRAEQDIAADFFALRKSYEGNRWVFSEARNTLNPNSHCDIAWAGALATYANASRITQAGAAVA